MASIYLNHYQIRISFEIIGYSSNKDKREEWESRGERYASKRTGGDVEETKCTIEAKIVKAVTRNATSIQRRAIEIRKADIQVVRLRAHNDEVKAEKKT